MAITVLQDSEEADLMAMLLAEYIQRTVEDDVYLPVGKKLLTRLAHPGGREMVNSYLEIEAGQPHAVRDWRLPEIEE